MNGKPVGEQNRWGVLYCVLVAFPMPRTCFQGVFPIVLFWKCLACVPLPLVLLGRTCIAQPCEVCTSKDNKAKASGPVDFCGP